MSIIPAMKKRKRDVIFAILAVFSILLVGVWDFVSQRVKSPYASFSITSSDLLSFEPEFEGWDVKRMDVRDDPIEPNVSVHELNSRVISESRQFFSGRVRLVHGYNMPDCMRIKHYDIKLLKEHLTVSDEAVIPFQMWQLTSSMNYTSIWVTTMLDGYSITCTDKDVCEMAFPRIGTADDPDWLPEGITVEGLKNPIVNGKKLIQTKWNNSRGDMMVFLGLRRPAWASEDYFTFVTVLTANPSVMVNDDSTGTAYKIHSSAIRQLQRWWGDNNKGAASGKK